MFRFLLAAGFIPAFSFITTWVSGQQVVVGRDNASESELPTVAEGWQIELLAEAPLIHAPTSVVQADDGTLFLGQDPMNMNGPPTERRDAIVSLRFAQGKPIKKTFAEGLGAVMGLELIGDQVFVAHAPLLTALRDTNGDGVADERYNLIEGLGREDPAFNGYNDHVISGIRAGMDGFLYVTFGDKGIYHAVARDGTVLRVRGGGVLRVRPDGQDAEIMVTGLRNPLSPALDQAGNVFTYGNDDDSKQWPNAIIHTIDGGHYGYPYEFLQAPQRCLPIVDGEIGGAGSQGFCFKEAGLDPQFHGDLFFADWGLRRIVRFSVEPQGGSFRLVDKSDVVTAGPLANFRPVCAAVGADGNSILITDWALGSILRRDAKAGRLFRLSWRGSPSPIASHRFAGAALETLSLDQLFGLLSSKSYRLRLRAQRELIRRCSATTSAAKKTIDHVIEELNQRSEPHRRVHLLWVLDAIVSPRGHDCIRQQITSSDDALSCQAIRSVGNRRDVEAHRPLVIALGSKSPVIRREAAIALGRIQAPGASAALLAALGDEDRFTAWSMARALERLDDWDAAALAAAIMTSSGTRHEQLIRATEGIRQAAVVDAWCRVLAASDVLTLQQTACRQLANLYFDFAPWDGFWWGTNPLVGQRTLPSVVWSESAATRIVAALQGALVAPHPPLRLAAVQALAGIESSHQHLATSFLLEQNPEVQRAILKALAAARPAEFQQLFIDVFNSVEIDVSVQLTAVEALSRISSPQATAALLLVSRQPAAPELVVQAALAELGGRQALSAETLRGMLKSQDTARNLIAFEALAEMEGSADIWESPVLAGIESPRESIRLVAVRASGAKKYRAAIPVLLAILSQDPSAKLKEAIMLALAKMPTPLALEWYLEGTAALDPELRQRSIAALAALPDVKRKLRQRVQEGTTADAAYFATERLVTNFQSLAGWHVLGPFPREIPRDLPGITNPDYARSWSGVAGETVRWRPFSTDESGVWTFDTWEVQNRQLGFDNNNSSQINVFAHAVFESATARRGLLAVGSAGSLQVWVNGQQVYRFRDWAGRPFVADENIVRIEVQKGRNEILCLSHVGVGSWQAAIQLSDLTEPALALPTEGVSRAALAAFASQNRGDPLRGRQLFFDRQRTRCSYCHAVAGQGGKIGPDLAGFAAKFNRAEAIRSVLDPSNRLAQGYISTLVATEDGRVLSGLVRHESQDVLELVDPQGRTIRLSQDEIAERRPTQVSIMPAGLADQLSPDEFGDLIQYLMTLKRQQKSLEN
ncbi:MAG: c-type cytochrome [Pirellulaceae bacterium]|nr:c-type cytochrome [Pirellulaceae bacterium]